MNYTVTQFAKISGVSVRTLHYYHEKGILNPSHHGINGYRYYNKEQLLCLQKIIFYKQLGLELKNIKKILSSSSSEINNILLEHKKSLIDEINTKTKLILDIDKNIQL